MKLSPETKRLLWFFAIYLFISWALVGVYFFTHAPVSSHDWTAWHNDIADGGMKNSTQFRLLSFWLAEGIHHFMQMPINLAYFTLRFIFTFTTLVLFHFFLLKWFEEKEAFLGTILLAALTPLTYMPFLQESDMVLMPFFLLALFFSRERKLLPLALIVFIGTFAKETIAFCVPFYLIARWEKGRTVRTIMETALLAAVWGLAFYITRNAFYDGLNSHLWQLGKNIRTTLATIRVYPLTNYRLYFIPVFGALWILPFLRLRQKPLFFKRTAIFIPLYTALSFLLGWPHETRIMLPLAFLIIPASILTLFPETLKKTASALMPGMPNAKSK
ncbi:MAG: hypothetical protein PHY34_02080 [Patescibacteria group bacterium]|nr:hypothetical protein [Patescibacteria group bacterium]MDD5715278.1 hypothetical protein [Patescibacteria group bacterium]